MNNDETNFLAASLEKADEGTLREIVREAESYLSAQLTVGLASDSRSMTFASVIAAIASFLIGGVAALVGGKIDVWPHIAPALFMAGALLIAICYAVRAARPTSFEYCGNDPEFWAPDLTKGMTLKQSLAGQAAIYSRDIKRNAEVLSESQACLNIALRWALIGLFGAVVIEVIFVLHMFYAAHG